MDLRMEEHRSKGEFLSYHIKGTYCLHDLGLLLVDFNHLAEVVFFQIVHYCKVTV